MRSVLAAFLCLIAMLAWPVAAQTFPPLSGRVVDQAHLLTPEQVFDLTSKSAALEQQSGGRQFVVATVTSLEGYPIEDYAYRLGREWKLGSAKNDDGVLLLVAPNERKVWIATGYGAGGYLTDAIAGIITRETILPHFKQNPPDYGGGIEAGADAVIKQMELPPDQAQRNVTIAERSQKERRGSGGGAIPAIFWAMIFAFVVLSMFRRGSGRRYYRRGGVSPWVVLWGLNELGRGSRGGGGWSSGGSSWGGGGGGFGGFSGGGGSFGGGGAGGSW